MNKAELVEAVATKAKLTKSAAQDAIDATICAMTGALKKGDEIRVTGFGALVVKKRGARKGINPATGKAITIKACKAVAFKASKQLKEVVNK